MRHTREETMTASKIKHSRAEHELLRHPKFATYKAFLANKHPQIPRPI